MGDWAGFFAHAGARHNAVNIAAGPLFGIPASTLRQRAKREGWAHPHPSVVVLPGTPDSFWTRASALLASLETPQLAEAAVTALSHRSAAWVHGLVDEAPASPIEVVRTRGARTSQRRGGKVRSSRTLTDVDCTEVQGLVVTRPARTVRDLAVQQRANTLRGVVLSALQRRVVTVEELSRQLDSLRGTVGFRRLLEVLGDVRDTPVDSPFEYEVVTAARQRGLRPLPCFPWRCPDGRVIHFDLAFPGAWVAAECDGRGKYVDGSSFMTDRIRWSEASPHWSMVWIDVKRWRRQQDAILDELTRRVLMADPQRAPAPQAGCRCRGCVQRGYATAS